MAMGKSKKKTASAQKPLPNSTKPISFKIKAYLSEWANTAQLNKGIAPTE